MTKREKLEKDIEELKKRLDTASETLKRMREEKLQKLEEELRNMGPEGDEEYKDNPIKFKGMYHGHHR